MHEYKENKISVVGMARLENYCDYVCVWCVLHIFALLAFSKLIECCLANNIHQSPLFPQGYSVLVFIISQPPALFPFHFHVSLVTTVPLSNWMTMDDVGYYYCDLINLRERYPYHKIKKILYRIWALQDSF